MKTTRTLLYALVACAALGTVACNSTDATADATTEISAGLTGDATIGTTATVVTTAALVNHPGKLLASNCFQCHGTDGAGPGFDSLKGKSASELYKEMKEMQGTTEADEAIMAVHAQSYSDAQIKLIADYFSKVQ